MCVHIYIHIYTRAGARRVWRFRRGEHGENEGDEKVGEEKTEVRADVEGNGRAVNLPGPLDGRRIRQLVRIHCIVFSAGSHPL